MANVIELLRNEFAYFLKNKLSFLMLFFVPLLLTVFFGGLYSHHKVTEVRLAVLDEDNTSLSRAITENFDRSEKFQITEYLKDQTQIGDYLNSNRVDAVIFIPRNFAKDIKRNVPVEVGTFTDGSNMIIANTVLSGASEIIQTTQAGVLLKVLEGMSVAPVRAKNLVQLIQFRNRTWYNPTFNYIDFMVLGLISAVIQQITLFQTAQAFIRDKINNKDIYWKNEGMSYGVYYFSKSLFYWLASILNCSVTFFVASYFFAIPIKGSVITLFIAISIFSAAVSSLGFLFSLIAKTEMSANQYAMIVSSPAFLISGFTWPLFAMPSFFQWLGKSIPLTHFLLAVRGIAIRGAGGSVVLPYLEVLVAMMVIFIVLSLIILQKQWQNSVAPVKGVGM